MPGAGVSGRETTTRSATAAKRASSFSTGWDDGVPDAAAAARERSPSTPPNSVRGMWRCTPPSREAPADAEALVLRLPLALSAEAAAAAAADDDDDDEAAPLRS